MTRSDQCQIVISIPFIKYPTVGLYVPKHESLRLASVGPILYRPNTIALQ